MKKKLVLLTAALTLAMGLVACGKKEEKPAEAPAEAPKTEVADTTEAPADHEHGDVEWIGEYELEAGEYLFHFGKAGEETLDVAFLKLTDDVKELDHYISHIITEEKETIEQETSFDAESEKAYTLVMNMDEDHGHIDFVIKDAGKYAIGAQHHPSEFTLQIFNEEGDEILPVAEHEIH